MKIPYTVSRSIVIKASPRKVYTVARDMNQAVHWSPWFKTDPTSKINLIKGDGKKLGSTHAWDGPILGAGEQETVELKTDKLIRHDLRFFKPWKSTASATMTFKKVKAGTKVTWTLDATWPVFLFPMKKKMMAWIGSDYERGLSMLADYIETGEVLSKVSFKGTETMEGFYYLGKTVSGDTKDVKKVVGTEFYNLWKWAEKNPGIKFEPVFTICHKWNFVSGKFKSTVGVGVKKKPDNLPPGFKYKQLKGGKAFLTEHKGDYKHLATAWSAANMYFQAHKLKKGKGDPIEVYLNDPREIQTKNIRTGIYLPVK